MPAGVPGWDEFGAHLRMGFLSDFGGEPTVLLIGPGAAHGYFASDMAHGTPETAPFRRLDEICLRRNSGYSSLFKPTFCPGP